MKDVVVKLRALSDETRVRILMLLDERELRQDELMNILDMSDTTAMRHLAALSEAGLLHTWNSDVSTHYALNRDSKGTVSSDVIEALRARLSLDQQVTSDRTKMKVLVRRPPERHR